MVGLGGLVGFLAGPGLGTAAQLDLAVRGTHAAIGAGFCGLAFDPGPAAFRGVLAACRPAGLALVHAPLGRLPVAQGLAAQDPAPASVTLAQAADSH